MGNNAKITHPAYRHLHCRGGDELEWSFNSSLLFLKLILVVTFMHFYFHVPYKDSEAGRGKGPPSRHTLLTQHRFNVDSIP